jgi:biopolymer transport protein TolR
MEFQRRRKIEANIDMTPMIDTLLQLFMIFLLSASFVASAVRLNLPKASSNQTGPIQAVVVSLDAGNHLFVNNDPTNLQELPTRLTTLFRKSKDP